jgi:hypothetical protein
MGVFSVWDILCGIIQKAPAVLVTPGSATPERAGVRDILPHAYNSIKGVCTKGANMSAAFSGKHDDSIKLYRRIQDHPWLNKRSEWFMGWSYILINADHETGRVNLTETYRELSKHFNRQRATQRPGKWLTSRSTLRSLNEG